MPRNSAASAAIPTGTTARLRPPPDLTGPEKEIFLATVLACRPDHFQDSDAPLLAAYCRTVVLEKVASGELSASGYVVDGNPSAWLNVLTAATRSMTVISRLLRLNPVARLASSSEPEAVSYYERMSLEARRDPEPN
jgi:phage terminase small subunit